VTPKDGEKGGETTPAMRGGGGVYLGRRRVNDEFTTLSEKRAGGRIRKF